MRNQLLKFCAVVLTSILVSCSGGGNPEDDAKKICDCMKAAEMHETKMKDCEKQRDELVKKYEGNKEAKDKMEKIISDCRIELIKIHSALDSEKLCDCMKRTVNDLTIMDECMMLAEEMEIKYKGSKEAEMVIKKEMDKCEKEMANQTK